MVLFEEAVTDWTETGTTNSSMCSDCIENLCGCDSEGGNCDTANDNCTNDV